MRPGELRTGDSVSRRPKPCTGSRAAHQAIRSVSVSTGVLVEPRTDIFGDADGTRQCQLAPVRSHRDRFRVKQLQVGFQTARHWRRGARPSPDQHRFNHCGPVSAAVGQTRRGTHRPPAAIGLATLSREYRRPHRSLRRDGSIRECAARGNSGVPGRMYCWTRSDGLFV